MICTKYILDYQTGKQEIHDKREERWNCSESVCMEEVIYPAVETIMRWVNIMCDIILSSDVMYIACDQHSVSLLGNWFNEWVDYGCTLLHIRSEKCIHAPMFLNSTRICPCGYCCYTTN
jgi:hypothetical protein